MTDLQTLLTEMCWALVAHVNDEMREAVPIHAANAAKVMLATPQGQALAALVEAAEALGDFMRTPDTDADGKPADWGPAFDVIGTFCDAIDHLREVTR